MGRLFINVLIKYIQWLGLVYIWISATCRGWPTKGGRSDSNNHPSRAYLPGLVTTFQTTFCVIASNFSVFFFGFFIETFLSIFSCQEMCIVDIILCKTMNDCITGAQKKQTHLLARSNWRGKIIPDHCCYNTSQNQSELLLPLNIWHWILWHLLSSQ